MHLAILGTGAVGRTLAAAFSGLGHSVTVGTREPAETMRREDFATWAGDHDDIRVASFEDAAAAGDLVVNAGNGVASLSMVEAAGLRNLAGKVLIDVSNPLDFSRGFPPTLTVKDTDSLAEQIQRAVPETRVVKAFNTMSAAVMVDPGAVGDGDTTVFLAGDDAEAKTQVTALLTELGWRDILDVGDISAARGLEMWLPLWVRLMGVIGTPAFNVKIVR